jgi:ABC-2 type transport system ATP-binding protein
MRTNLPNPDEQQIIAWSDGLTKDFGGGTGVMDLTLKIPRGAIFGLIGPSGCGKTTTVRLLLGIYRPTSGRAEVFGREPQHFSMEDREKIGYMPQLFMLQPGLSVWQNLSFAASLYGMSLNRSARLEEMLELVELDGHEHKRARNLSGGMQRRLSLAASLVHEPEMVFLDEPTGGIDPVLRRKFWDFFQELKAQGCTLVVTTQYVSEAAYCDYVAVMSEGRLLMVETPENLKRVGMGGEVIDLRFDGFISQPQMQALRQQPFVQGAKAQILDDLSLEIIVDDAAEAMPALLRWCEQNQIVVQEASKVEPTFDDVFVKVIEEHRSHA